MGEAKSSALLFKGSFLRDYRRTSVSAFSWTTNQFISNWRQRPNQSPINLRGPSVQEKGAGRETSFNASNRKSTDVSWFIMTPVTASYLRVSLPTSSVLALLFTKGLSSSPKVEIQADAVSPRRVIPCKTGIAFNLRRKGCNTRMYVSAKHGNLTN